MRGRRGAALTGGAGFSFTQDLHGHMALTGGAQLVDFRAQTAGAELLKVLGEFHQGISARQLTAVQQPGQSTAVQAAVAHAAVLFRLAVHRPPVQPQAITGTGQGHIGQAQLLGETLMAGALAVLIKLFAAQIEQRCAVVGVTGDVFMLAQQRAVPQIRAEHQRVLQALGGVDGDNLHPFGIAFQAQQGVFTMGLGTELGIEPAEQLLQARTLQTLGLQQLGQVQQVGQPPLAIH